jgi:hypothetical protein
VGIERAIRRAVGEGGRCKGREGWSYDGGSQFLCLGKIGGRFGVCVEGSDRSGLGGSSWGIGIRGMLWVRVLGIKTGGGGGYRWEM